MLPVIPAFWVDEFYNEYFPKEYKRTFQLRDVLPCEIYPIIQGNKVTCGIDLSKFERVNYRQNNIIDLIINEALLHGSHGLYINTETAPYIEMEKDLQQNIHKFVDVLRDNLIKAGFIVK